MISDPNDLVAVRKAVQAAGIDYDSAEVQFVASFDQEVDSVEDAQKLFRIVDALEDLDDVQTVFTNADLTPEVEAALDSED
ncbi:putative transcriptional regulatory protein [bioreactor metagenome]|uniref:Putative transcriptional regulatory protein n=1 Tax=bioreactor metagenome TaxID=1076179 RepID=A0A645A930_9ZZZZ